MISDPSRHGATADAMEGAPEIEEGLAILPQPNRFDLTVVDGMRADLRNGNDCAVERAKRATESG